jgi:porin
VGRLAFDVYLDAFMFQTFSRGFLNRSFVVNPTLATTGVGAIGGVAKGFVSDNFWIGGQIHDGNAASGDFDWDTVEQREWLAAGALGWAPAIDRYKSDRIQLTYWHKDSRRKARVPEGHGVALSASYQVAPGIIPFTRIGWSDGGAGVAAKRAASVGVEYAVRSDQALSVGIGWADPSKKTYGKTLGDEYVFETSYRFQLTPTLSIMPDVQLLKDPARNPREDYVWVGSLRANIAL